MFVKWMLLEQPQWGHHQSTTKGVLMQAPCKQYKNCSTLNIFPASTKVGATFGVFFEFY